MRPAGGNCVAVHLLARLVAEGRLRHRATGELPGTRLSLRAVVNRDVRQVQGIWTPQVIEISAARAGGTRTVLGGWKLEYNVRAGRGGFHG